MNRVSGQRNIWRSPKAVESVGPPPKITNEGNFLVLRWTKEEAGRAMDAAGLTLDRVIAKYLFPAAEVTKTCTDKDLILPMGGLAKLQNELLEAAWIQQLAFPGRRESLGFETGFAMPRRSARPRSTPTTEATPALSVSTSSRTPTPC